MDEVTIFWVCNEWDLYCRMGQNDYSISPQGWEGHGSILRTQPLLGELLNQRLAFKNRFPSLSLWFGEKNLPPTDNTPPTSKRKSLKPVSVQSSDQRTSLEEDEKVLSVWKGGLHLDWGFVFFVPLSFRFPQQQGGILEMLFKAPRNHDNDDNWTFSWDHFAQVLSLRSRINSPTQHMNLLWQPPLHRANICELAQSTKTKYKKILPL